MTEPDASDDSAEPSAGEQHRALPGNALLDAAIGPLARTGRYYAGSWRHYLSGRGRGELPLTRPTLSLAAHALRDEIVLQGLRVQRPLSQGDAFDRINLEVTEALEFYGAKGYLDKPEKFFKRPPKLTDLTLEPVKTRRHSYQRLVFDSGYAPDPAEPGAERWQSYTGNRRVYGLLLRHPEPRPWLVCVHGAEMGRAGVDLTLFRAWHLHEDFGLNLLLPVLPMHGPRARNLPKGRSIPGEDVLDDVHFAAQSVWDVRRVLSWIRAQEPESAIGLNSISLGGYVTSLVASLEDGLTCAILGVPVADLVELLGRHSWMGPEDPRREAVDHAAPLGRMVSPLSLQPRVPMSGRFVYGGVADRVVHPRHQVERLWEHWGKPEIVWYRGGHTGFFTRPVQRFIDAALVQSGLVGPAPAARKADRTA